VGNKVDYRVAENREVYFQSLYKLNLSYKIHPGLVYLYVPELRKRFGWGVEETLWFVTLNGHTQNPITSLRLFEKSPEIPSSEKQWKSLEDWFNEEWPTLAYDTDRRKQKRNTIEGLKSYSGLITRNQESLWRGKSYEECWETANSIHSFGRLSTFSYLEYVRIAGVGPDCTDLMFRDFSGSKSHRNGMFFLLGMDSFVFDKRLENGQDGKYENFVELAGELENKANVFLEDFKKTVLNHTDVSRFTMESCLCQFKNGFFKRRFPGVYSDMGWDRIKWYEERGFNELTKPFREIRAEHLPEWLREECEMPVVGRKVKAAQFAETGIPYRGEWIL
jgi:hypothetical protein